MTKKQYQAALQEIKKFLVCRFHFDSKKAQKGINDGHWMVKCIEDAIKSGCSESYGVFVNQLLQRLENGSFLKGDPLEHASQSPWKPEFTDHIRSLTDPQ